MAAMSDLLFARGCCSQVRLVLGLLFFLLALFCVRYRAFQSWSIAETGYAKAWHWEVKVGRAASFLCFLALFVWGAVIYFQIYRTPPDELSVFVVAKQWMWKVQHLRAANPEINALHIPVNIVRSDW